MRKNLSEFFKCSDLNPFAIGFDDIWNSLDIAVNNNSLCGYPPYNIEVIKQDGSGVKQNDSNDSIAGYKLTLAVAGFDKSEIKVTATDHDLIVQGIHKEGGETQSIEGPNKAPLSYPYLFKGIARRTFTRNFALDNVRVKSAKLENGILTILLDKHPETKRQAIQIE